MKRKNASGESEHSKRFKLDSTSHKKAPNQSYGQRVKKKPSLESRLEPRSFGVGVEAQMQSKEKGKGKERGKEKATTPATALVKATPQPSIRRENIRKLAPPRPFPTIHNSVSASGPKSAHKEGKNLICITRHTPLAAYLSRCKKLLVDEGYNMLSIHAMGAAIPHLLTLTVSLPAILPFAKDNIRIEIRTGTIEVLDEIMPDDEDEEISVRTRGKGGVSVILKIKNDGDTVGANDSQLAEGSGVKGKHKEVIVVQEQEQKDEELN